MELVRLFSNVKVAMFTLLCVACATCSVGDPAKDARLVIMARLEELQNVTAEYSERETFLPPADVVAKFKSGKTPSGQSTPNRRVKLVAGEFVRKGLFRFLHGHTRYESELVSSPGGGAPFDRSVVWCFTPERIEQRITPPNGGPPRGGILDPSKASLPDAGIDCALGLRTYRSANWLTPEKLSAASLTFDGEGGTMSAALRSADGDGMDTWEYLPKEGYAMRAYRCVRNGKLVFEARNDGFDSSEATRGVSLPTKIDVDFFNHATGKQQVTRSKRLEVSRYVVTDPENTADAFTIVWPTGADVLDERLGKTFHVATQPRSLDDDTLQSAAAKHVQARQGRAGLVGIFLALNICGAALAAVWFFLRRRRNRAATL